MMTIRTRVPTPAVYAAQITAIAAVYFGAAKLGLLAAVAQKVVSSAWPPSGVALAALLLLGLRYWPGIALGAFLLNWTAGVPLAGAAGIAGGNALEAVTAVWLLRRVAFRPSLERLRDVLALVILGAAASTMVSATAGVTSLWASGVVERSVVGRLWIVWWSGDALGVLLVVPLLITWARTTRPPGRWPEAVALVLALVLLTTPLLRSPLTYVYAVFPVVVWAALRFGPRGAGSAGALLAVMTVWYTLRGLGPFVGSTPTQNLHLLQTFLALSSVTGLVLAAVTAERREAERVAREGEQRFRLLVESVQDYAIFRLDPTGRVVTWNAGAEQLNGYTAPEIIGRHFSCFYASEDAAAGKPAANLREATERGRCETQGWRMRKDGSRYWADVVISPVRDEGGALLGFAKVTRDLTERRRADERVEHHRRQLRELAARAEAAREAERIHIAREIHDELGQALTALRIDLAWLRKRLPRGTADLAGKIDGMAAIIDGTADALQRVATELRPGVLDQVGLPAAVQWQASDFQARTGIACQVELAVQQPELDSGRATAAFRILQEALTNVARHSEATRVLIRFAVSPGALELAVQDNGRGITKGALADPRSLGLAGIRERATDLGGTVAITGTPGRGTTVTLSMPRGR